MAKQNVKAHANAAAKGSLQSGEDGEYSQGQWLQHLPNILILIYMIGCSLYFDTQLPDQIATKFDFAGNPTQYSSKISVLVLMPIVYAVTVVMVPFLTRISPKGFQLEQSQSLIPKTNTAAGLLLATIHTGVLLSSMDAAKYPPALWITFGLGLFLAFLGNIMSKSERNFFIGIRTPWTLASQANWRATHRFAAKLSVVTGFWLVLYSLFTMPSLVVTIIAVISAVTIPVFYSLWYYQRIEKPTENATEEPAE